MSEEAQEQPQVAEQSSEPEMPESFNIFSDKPAPVIQPNEAAPMPEEKQRSEAFVHKLKADKRNREKEIELKKREALVQDKIQALTNFEKSKQTLSQDPEKFLNEQGMDASKVYRRWTEKMLDPANGGKPTSEERIDQTAMEVARLKSELASRDQQSVNEKQESERQELVSNFCGKITSFAEANKESYPLVSNQMSSLEVAKGMSAYYNKTGAELSIQDAFKKLEEGLHKQEQDYFTSDRAIEKFKQYNPSIVAPNRVKGPRATMSSAWNEQPTRQSSDDMSMEDIKDMFKGKLFT